MSNAFNAALVSGVAVSFDPNAPRGIRLDQSELLGASDYILVGKGLQHSQLSDVKMIGRALVAAGSGKRFAAPDMTHNVARLMARELVAKRPFLDPGSAADALAAALSLQTELTRDEFIRMLETEQATQQTTSARRYEQPSLVPSNRTLIVFADGHFYLRAPDAGSYHAVLSSERALRVKLRDLASVVQLYDERGEMHKTDKLLQWYCTNAAQIVRDYSATETTFDAETETLTIGYALPQIDPVPSADVDRWLRALSGGAIDDLYDWIAASGQSHITKPASALGILGPKDTGKSLLATALARTWGCTAAVKLKDAVDRFNGPITRCPIWHADESMPEEMNTQIFRELIQSRQRDVEPKGQEKVILKGCPRVVITVNEMADFGLTGMNGPDAVDAVSDRLSLFNCQTTFQEARDALAKLRLPNSPDIDLDQVVKHLAYIQHEAPRPADRFLGMRSDRSASRAAALMGPIEQGSEVFEVLRQYVADPITFERSYHEEERSFNSYGWRFPIVSQHGSLWVYPTELAKRANVKVDRVHQALKPFCSGAGPKPLLQFGTFQARYWQLRTGDLAAALGAELGGALDAALARYTRDRRPAAAA